MLEAHDLTKVFPSGETRLTVFEHLNFTVSEGRFIIFTGRSGSGKSTLLYQLGLLDTPSGGEVKVDGIATSRLSNAGRGELRLRMFGYVFQDYGLLPEMSAQENVMLPLLMQGFSSSVARNMSAEALERVELAERLHFKPGQLSGGQQQRVSIARAIAHHPKYLIADEPTANLDSATAKTILDVFSQLHKEGNTILMATHESGSVDLADDMLEFVNGNLVSIRTTGPSTMVLSDHREGLLP